MRRALAIAIRIYRRHVSGRGPLRRVRCTFHATESCSAYGLRVAEELATSLPHALSLVRARLRACRCTSVYRFERGLGWERDHELPPAALADVLAARGERPDTIAQVLAARVLVAKWRGDRACFTEALHVARPASHPIPIRAGDAAIAHHRRATGRALVLAYLALLLASISLVALAPAVVAVGAAKSSHASARRLERQRIAAGFLRPAPTASI